MGGEKTTKWQLKLHWTPKKIATRQETAGTRDNSSIKRLTQCDTNHAAPCMSITLSGESVAAAWYTLTPVWSDRLPVVARAAHLHTHKDTAALSIGAQLTSQHSCCYYLQLLLFYVGIYWVWLGWCLSVFNTKNYSLLPPLGHKSGCKSYMVTCRERVCEVKCARTLCILMVLCTYSDEFLGLFWIGRKNVFNYLDIRW